MLYDLDHCCMAIIRIRKPRMCVSDRQLRGAGSCSGSLVIIELAQSLRHGPACGSGCQATEITQGRSTRRNVDSVVIGNTPANATV